MKDFCYLAFLISIISLALFSGCDLVFFTNGGMSTQERAVDAGDASICDSASSPGTCRIAVAKSKNDPAICNEIKDEAKQNTCKAQVSGGFSSDCGGPNEPCCEGYGLKNVCKGSTKCIEGLCKKCSIRGASCTNSVQCCEQLMCKEGVCISDGCGYTNEPCCEGGKCYSDHSCIGGVCKWDEGAPVAEEIKIRFPDDDGPSYYSGIGARG